MDSAKKDDKLTKVVGWFNKQLYNLIDWIFRKKSKDYSPDFKKLFFKNEIWALYGDRWSNFWKIIMLYIALFISVGFGVKSYQFFKQQLDNPFVRFISVPIQGDAVACPDLISSLQGKFMADSIKSDYNLESIRAFSTENPLQFSSDKVQTTFNGMADDYNSALILEAVCSKGNNYIGKPFGNVEERSAIVTLNLLKDLLLVDQNVTIEDLSEADIPGYIMFQPSGFGQEFPLLVQGVTEQLPYESDFLLPSKFNDYLFYDNSLLYHSSDDNSQVSYYIDAPISVGDLQKVIYPIVANYGINPSDGNLIIESTSSIHSNVLVSISNITDTTIANVLRQSITSQFKLSPDQIVDAYYKPYNMTGSGWVYKASQSSMLVVFENLKKVRIFNDSLKTISSEIITNTLMAGSAKKVKGIEVEMEKINLRNILRLIEFIVIGFIIIIAFLAGTSLMSFVKVIFGYAVILSFRRLVPPLRIAQSPVHSYQN